MASRWFIPALIVCLLFTAASSAELPGPLETLKGPINQVLNILNDPALKGPDQRKGQRNQIWNTVKPLFDFYELSRRAVGKNWQRFSKEEQTQFQDVFSKFLANTYMDKIQSDSENGKIVYVSELIRDDLALARTKLVRASIEMPIDYRMHNMDGKWKIYDVLVENGVSLVKNYRVQFTSFLQKESPAQLIEMLKKKLKEQNNELG